MEITDGCIDGVWTSGDILMRLINSTKANHRRYVSSGKYLTMSALMEVIEVSMPPGVRILEKTFVSVIPKRDSCIFIEDGGWVSTLPTGEPAVHREVFASIVTLTMEQVSSEAKIGNVFTTTGSTYGKRFKIVKFIETPDDSGLKNAWVIPV